MELRVLGVLEHERDLQCIAYNIYALQGEVSWVHHWCWIKVTDHKEYKLAYGLRNDTWSIRPPLVLRELSRIDQRQVNEYVGKNVELEEIERAMKETGFGSLRVNLMRARQSRVTVFAQRSCGSTFKTDIGQQLSPELSLF